ncbi:sodium-solute symporter putative [Vibrio maritimus]|uniref:Sodium-solute symporter putative n=1 Tax=Vibrio maritimus TaxID=990268 RepID=A0A090RY86_9VIBR|nr:sodium-solute symporter putative [Vibrio maritimus]
MVGLLIAAMFAATMSSMDSGLNRNSGIFVKTSTSQSYVLTQQKKSSLLFLS